MIFWDNELPHPIESMVPMTPRIYKTGLPRGQGMLLPPCLDDYVTPDNPIRAIDA